MIVTIHQPEFMPWLGFLDKISKAQKFIVLDNVQFEKNYFQNRNKIRVNNEKRWQWITVPVSFKFGDKILDVKIASQDWKDKVLRTIELNYKKTKYFEKYYSELEKILMKKYAYLINLNMKFIEFALKSFNIKTEIIFASNLGVNGKGSDLILDCCKKTGATTYISGISGKDYLNESDFKREGIEIEYQKFYHPIYKQLYEPFIPCMSFIDLLFNEQPEILFNPEKRMDKLIE